MPKSNHEPPFARGYETRPLALRRLEPKRQRKKADAEDNGARTVLDDGRTLHQIHTECREAIEEGLRNILPQPTLRLTPELVLQYPEAAEAYLRPWQICGFQHLLDRKEEMPLPADVTKNSVIFAVHKPSELLVESVTIESLRQLAELSRYSSWKAVVQDNTDAAIRQLARRAAVYLPAIVGPRDLISYTQKPGVRNFLASGMPAEGIPHPDDDYVRAELDRIIDRFMQNGYIALKRCFSLKSLQGMLGQLARVRCHLTIDIPANTDAWMQLLNGCLLPPESLLGATARSAHEERNILWRILVSRFVREDVLPVLDAATGGLDYARSALLAVLGRRWRELPVERYTHLFNQLQQQRCALANERLCEDDSDDDIRKLVHAIQLATPGEPAKIQTALLSACQKALAECKSCVATVRHVTLPEWSRWHSEWLCSARFLHNEQHREVHAQLTQVLYWLRKLVETGDSLQHQPLTQEQLAARAVWHKKQTDQRSVCACDRSLLAHAECLVHQGIVHWTRSMQLAYAELAQKTLPSMYAVVLQNIAVVKPKE